MNRPRKFLALCASDRALLLQACWYLGCACICLRAVPFRWIAGTMRMCRAEPPRHELSSDQLRMARQIRWAVRLAARHVPWRAVCLPQSLAAKVMLKRRGIAATLYLGVAKSIASMPGFDAHAWVRAGLMEVTPSRGQGALQGEGPFVIVAMFS